MTAGNDQRYERLERIGEGGMATVYRGYDKLLERPVALKVLNRRAEAAIKQQFLTEARSVARLNHPNIVDVYDVGEMDGAPYMVMEYVQGSNLKHLIQEQGALPLKRAIEIIEQVGEALSYAHQNGFIHCDVKPHNVIITPSGQAKLLDFGIAQAQVDRARKHAETILGTPLYVAPEQAAGERVTPRTDVYGLGLLLWEMLTGRPPERPAKGGPVTLDYRRSGLSPQLSSVISRATASNPADRYPTVEELLTALKGAAHGAGQHEQQTMQMTAVQRGTVGPPPPGPVLSKPVRSTHPMGRRFLILPAVAFILLVLGLAVSWLVPRLVEAWETGDPGAVLGQGDASVDVPQLTGMPVAEAADLAEQRGLSVVAVPAPNSSRPSGVVIRQSPTAGTSADRGSQVVLDVAGDASAIPDGVPVGTAEAANRTDTAPTPTVVPAAGEYVAQLLGLDESVQLTIRHDSELQELALEPGEYREVRGTYIRIEGDPASQVLVTVTRRDAQWSGTLLEIAEELSGQDIQSSYAFIEFGGSSRGSDDTGANNTGDEAEQSNGRGRGRGRGQDN